MFRSRDGENKRKKKVCNGSKTEIVSTRSRKKKVVEESFARDSIAGEGL
jgi:hypothetical protein